MLYIVHHATTKSNDKIDLNAQADLDLMTHLLHANALVSNEAGFLHQAFEDLCRPRGKVIFTSQQFVDFIQKLEPSWAVTAHRFKQQSSQFSPHRNTPKLSNVGNTRKISHSLDKTLLSRGRSIGGLFLLVKGYFASCCTEKQGLAMRLGKEGGSAAALLRNQHHLFPFVILHFRRV